MCMPISGPMQLLHVYDNENVFGRENNVFVLIWQPQKKSILCYKLELQICSVYFQYVSVHTDCGR